MLFSAQWNTNDIKNNLNECIIVLWNILIYSKIRLHKYQKLKNAKNVEESLGNEYKHNKASCYNKSP